MRPTPGQRCANCQQETKMVGHMVTSHVKETTNREPPNSQQQASAATVQNRAAGTFSHRKQRQQRKIDKSAKCGLPSQHASQETWKPPASTLAHRLAVIHPDNVRMCWPKGFIQPS